MRADPGRSDLLRRVSASSVEERVAWLAEMRAAGVWSAWQQVDRAGITDPLEVAEFLLRRLYPDLRMTVLAEILEQLRASRAAGIWHGFARPEA